MFRILALAAVALLAAPAPSVRAQDATTDVQRALAEELARILRLPAEERERITIGLPYTHAHGRFDTHTHPAGTIHAEAHGGQEEAEDDRERRRDGKVVPARCFGVVPGPNGGGRGYLTDCLERHARRIDLLPDACLRRVATWRTGVYVYNRPCLREAGWSEVGEGARD